jgi:hypothetical protein
MEDQRMRVALRLADNSQSQTLRGFLPLIMDKYRVQFINAPAGQPRPEADLWIVQQLCLEDANADGFGRLMAEVESFKAPYCLLERLDGANITGITRRLLCSDRPPEFVWKTSRYAERGFYNVYNGRLHESLIAKAFDGPEAASEIDEARIVRRGIPYDRLDRIHVPFNFGAFAHCQQILAYGDERAANVDRPIDVSFAGTTTYSGGLIETHRKSCCWTLAEMIHDTDLKIEIQIGRPLSHEQYADLLFNSKCVVSPCGWGETTYRDWEAIFAGCVLIKPCIEHLDDFPLCIHCRPDFSDLSEKIDRALVDRSWVVTRGIRTRAIRECSPDFITDRLWADMEAAVR